MSDALGMAVEAFGLSDPGCVRSNNEDYFINDKRAGIFILADGMGGARAGEYASQLSAERLYDFLLRTSPDLSLSDLEQGFAEANWVVREAARSSADFEGMGTTLLAARASGHQRLQLSSVGDSRAYRCAGGQLELLTRDQTWVAEIGTRLGLTADALKAHPMRHVLTMAIGCADEIRVQSESVQLRAGDQILLCSDGLHGVIDEGVIAQTLNSEKTLEEKCHYLIEAAKQQGGPDNVTVVLMQFT